MSLIQWLTPRLLGHGKIVSKGKKNQWTNEIELKQKVKIEKEQEKKLKGLL